MMLLLQAQIGQLIDAIIAICLSKEIKNSTQR